ncbi:hypothetical protein [Bifidobacterium cuniculi]|uniref:Uncharacterized protein n=1 Tax=Bifidobacterium cuniculi TaxID=1688 RepID=A0A087B4G3_9BIFI|nr:hypothetical protein [Bifidobacterium cuniculi]KFI65913.1 hypothetical protein BCUN_0412 [Bifidobacterium cuniculi]
MTKTAASIDPRLTDPDLVIDMLIAKASMRAASNVGATYAERLDRAMQELGPIVRPI